MRRAQDVVTAAVLSGLHVGNGRGPGTSAESLPGFPPNQAGSGQCDSGGGERNRARAWAEARAASPPDQTRSRNARVV